MPTPKQQETNATPVAATDDAAARTRDCLDRLEALLIAALDSYWQPDEDHDAHARKRRAAKRSRSIPILNYPKGVPPPLRHPPAARDVAALLHCLWRISEMRHNNTLQPTQQQPATQEDEAYVEKAQSESERNAPGPGVRTTNNMDADLM